MRFEDSVCRGSLIPLIYRERETEREGEAETQAGRKTNRQKDIYKN